MFLVMYENEVNEWGAIGAQGLTPYSILYEPHINSRMVHEERPGAGEQMM